MLSQYLACIAAHGWARLVFETHGGAKRFDFSCRPSYSTPDLPRLLCAQNQNSTCPAAQQGGKRWANVRRHEREKKRRIAWIKERKCC
jgi:hypothetical protein